MNILKVLASITQDVAAAKDLIATVQALHDDPAFKALIASNPDIAAKAAKISADARTISESFR